MKLIFVELKFVSGLRVGWGFEYTSVLPRKKRATSTTEELLHRQTISRVKSDTYGVLMSGRDSLNKTEDKR